MKLPIIKDNVFFTVLLIFSSGFVGYISLLIGAAHLIDAFLYYDANIPTWEHLLGIAFCIGLCIVGILSFWVMLGAIKGLYQRFSKESH